jgi:hypothetical protein
VNYPPATENSQSEPSSQSQSSIYSAGRDNRGVGDAHYCQLEADNGLKSKSSTQERKEAAGRSRARERSAQKEKKSSLYRTIANSMRSIRVGSVPWGAAPALGYIYAGSFPGAHPHEPTAYTLLPPGPAAASFRVVCGVWAQVSWAWLNQVLPGDG